MAARRGRCLFAAVAAASLVRAARHAGSRIAVHAEGATCDITAYGAVGDNRTDNTAAITAAWAACAAPGSTLLIPSVAGSLSVYVTGPMQAPAPLVNFALVVEAGATVRFAVTAAAWPQPLDCINMVHGGGGIAITGGGVFDGVGAPWWPNKNGFRPRMLHVDGSPSGLLIAGVTFVNRCVQALLLAADGVARLRA